MSRTSSSATLAATGYRAASSLACHTEREESLLAS